MASKIEWTDATWNPITGCTKVSEGCKNCYAERMAKRLKAMGNEKYRNGFDVRFHKDCLREPLSWKKPRKIFVCSMGDLFHSEVGHIDFMQVWHTIEHWRQHTFIILTKRPQNMSYRLFNWAFGTGPVGYLSNVWLGVTVENDKHLGRIKWLQETKAAVRLISIEPMLGPMSIRRWLYKHDVECDCGWTGLQDEDTPDGGFRKLYPDEDDWGKDWGPENEGLLREGRNVETEGAWVCPACNQPEDMGGFRSGEFMNYPPSPTLDWVICGGETGPGARYMDPDWARDIRDQCKEANVPFFFKKMSNKAPIPDDLMIREYPNVS